MNWQYGGRTGKEGDYIFSFSLNHLQIPVHIRFTHWHLYVEGGAYIGYFMNGTIRQEIPRMEGNIQRDRINTIDLGLSVGCGIDFDIFSVNLGYNYGLQNYYPKLTSIINSIQFGIAFRLINLQI